MTEVTKSGLAKHLGKSPAMVTKIVKSGVLDDCFSPNGKKIYLEKAIQTLEMARQRRHDKCEDGDDEETDGVYTPENKAELDQFIKEAKSPSQKVQIIKDFWAGKINRQKFLRDRPKYRKARMVIFGMSQYHKAPTPTSIVKRVLQLLKDITNIDVCMDSATPPDLARLEGCFNLCQYQSSTYINDTGIPMIERILFYNKALKNALGSPLWRMEATVSIPNWRMLALPLLELKGIAKTVWGQNE